MEIPCDRDYGDFIGGKDLVDVKPDVPVFVLSPGRYYSRVAFMSLPAAREFPEGGDMLSLLWRYDTGRTDYWYVGVRYRYYKGARAFQSDDQKTWHIYACEGPEEKAERQFEATWNSFAGAALAYFGERTEPQVLQIRGDWLRFRDVVLEANPIWFHFPSAAAAQLFRP